MRYTDSQFEANMKNEMMTRRDKQSQEIASARKYWQASQQKKQAEREELQSLQNEAEKEEYKHAQKQAWIAAGGDSATFEETWHTTWLSELKRRVGENAAETSTRQYLNSRVSYDF